MIVIASSLAALLSATHRGLQTTPPPPKTAADSVARSKADAAPLKTPLTGVEVDLQVARDYDTKVQSNYVNLQYNSRSLYETGKQTTALPLDLTNDVKLSNADPGFLLSYLGGNGSLGGNFFTANNIAPLNFTANLLPGLNTMIDVGVGTADTKPLEAVFGLQTQPQHPLIGLKFVPNWLTIGLNGHYRSESGMATSTVGEANFKAYASTAIWAADSKRATMDLHTWANKNAPTWKQAVSHFQGLKVAEGNGQDVETQLTIAYRQYNSVGIIGAKYEAAAAAARTRLGLAADAVVPQDQLLTDAEWLDVVKGWEDGYVVAHRYYPALLLYGEAQGSYSLTNDVIYRRYNSLWAAGVKFNLGHIEGSQSCYIELRYQHGFSDATRTMGTNALITSFNVKF